MKEINIKVSVAVITFNSSKTVLETLNSILRQTYSSKYIELIISDDCSTDSTIDEIELWISKYKAEFHNVRFFKSEKNSGVTKNCNIAWQACSGEWIKTIAGDDLLYPVCIEEFMKYISETPEAECVFSGVTKFDDDFGVINYTYRNKKIFSYNSNIQFKFLLTENFLLAPSNIIKLSTLKHLGFADVNYSTMEDYPLWLKIVSSGRKMYYLDKPLVKYRMGESISQSKKQIMNPSLMKETNQLIYNYITSKSRNKDWLYYILICEHYYSQIKIKIFKSPRFNSKTKFNLFIYRVCSFITPARIAKLILKIKYR